MKNSKLILFENQSANFRLSIDTMYEKQKADGTTQSTVFINPKNDSGTFRPSVFLVFTYLTDDFNTTKGIYTTIPHMYKIRQAFQQIHDMLILPDSFMDIDGSLGVTPSFAQPIVIDNLNQKNNDWISLMLSPYQDQTSLMNKRGVALQHSKSNGYSSLLTEEEFLSIYDLIMHIDMVSLENQAVILELLSRGGVKQPTTYNQGQQQSSFANYVNSSRAPQPNRTTTAYNQAPAPAFQRQQPMQQTRPVQQNSAPLPPRPATTKMMNMDEIENIPIDDLSLDDTAAVDSVFNS